MIQTVSFYDFERAFVDMGRDEQFTYKGKRALFDYLEELEEDLGEKIELDVIALCCDYTEYASLEEFQAEYDEVDYPDLDAIRDNTQVIEIPGTDGFIIQCF